MLEYSQRHGRERSLKCLNQATRVNATIVWVKGKDSHCGIIKNIPCQEDQGWRVHEHSQGQRERWWFWWASWCSWRTGWTGSVKRCCCGFGCFIILSNSRNKSKRLLLFVTSCWRQSTQQSTEHNPVGFQAVKKNYGSLKSLSPQTIKQYVQGPVLTINRFDFFVHKFPKSGL